jgi:hypothetical protein
VERTGHTEQQASGIEREAMAFLGRNLAAGLRLDALRAAVRPTVVELPTGVRSPAIAVVPPAERDGFQAA